MTTTSVQPADAADVWDTGTPQEGAVGLPVVLLHGWTGSKEDFADLVPVLAARRRVIAPDLPGHGDCPPATGGDYSLGAHVSHVQQLLADRAVDGVHLVAHSHGGLVAQRLAYLMAGRIGSLTLIGSGLGALGEESSAMVIRVATAARDDGMEAAWAQVRGADEGESHPDGSDADDPREAFVRRRFLAMDPEVVVGVARNLLTAMPLGAFLRGVDFPVLVCHGEGDRTWLPHEQQLLARTINGAQYQVIPDALHSPATENPDGLLAVLGPFLAAADGRPTAPPPPRRRHRPRS